MPKKLILISDLHIGGEPDIEDFQCGAEFGAFVDHLLNTSFQFDLELIINGDFFDLWKCYDQKDEKINYIIAMHQNLFDKLKEFGNKNKITVIPGNHDHELVYNKKLQDDLKKYNINVDPNQFFKRELSKKNKKFIIIGEHGNQVEPASSFTDFYLPTESSLSYHVTTQFVYRLMRLGTKKKKPHWMHEVDNVDTDLIPYWLLSKYFYNEIGPILKSILVPMLILFSLAIPYFIFDIVTDFYQPRFLMPVINFLDTNLIMKGIIFILYFDMVVVILLLFASLLRKDFNKRLRGYGVQSLSDILLSKQRSYKEKARDVINGLNPFNTKADLYITGHTHCAVLHKEDNMFLADTGSWKQLTKRVPAYFRFPPIFYPFYLLSYVEVYEQPENITVELRAWPKPFTSRLTILEKIFIKRKKNVPEPILADTLIKTYSC
ncbi:metallophosphoesterase [Candidatus Peregrinibacteria bacterium]|nr:metallophosphoesterase [Candidatus Peregrinibacteria bacterium]